MDEKTERFTQVCKPLVYKAVNSVRCCDSNPIINSKNDDQKCLSQRVVVNKRRKWPMMRAKSSQTMDKIAEDKMTQFPDVVRQVQEKEYIEYEVIKPSGSTETVYKKVVSDIKYNHLNNVEDIKTHQYVNKRTINADNTQVSMKNIDYVENSVGGRTYKKTESVTQSKGRGKETRRRQLEFVSSTQPRNSRRASRSSNIPRGSTKLGYILRPPPAGGQEAPHTLKIAVKEQRSGGGKVESFHNKRQNRAESTVQRPSNRKSQESSEHEMVEGLKQMTPNKSDQQLQTLRVSKNLIRSNKHNSELSIIEDEKLTEGVATVPRRSDLRTTQNRDSRLSEERPSKKSALGRQSQVSSKNEPAIDSKAENSSTRDQSYATSNEDLTVDEANGPQKLFNAVESVVSFTGIVTKSSTYGQEAAMRQSAVGTKDLLSESEDFVQNKLDLKPTEESKESVYNSGQTKIKTHVYKETDEEKSDAEGNLIKMINIDSTSDTEIVEHKPEADEFPIEDAETEESEEDEYPYPNNPTTPTQQPNNPNCFRPQCTNAYGYCCSSYWRMRNMRGCNNYMNYPGLPNCNGQCCSYNCCYSRQR